MNWNAMHTYVMQCNVCRSIVITQFIYIYIVTKTTESWALRDIVYSLQKFTKDYRMQSTHILFSFASFRLHQRFISKASTSMGYFLLSSLKNFPALFFNSVVHSIVSGGSLKSSSDGCGTFFNSPAAFF